MLRPLVYRTGFALTAIVLFSAAACSDDPAEGDLTITPGDSNVATCRALTFEASPSEDVSWTVEGEGEINAAGLYTAPISVPSPATATIEASTGDGTASVTVSLATAFPESGVVVGDATESSTVDIVHAVSARGMRVYALLQLDGSVSLASSEDGGLTWGSPVFVTGGDVAVAASLAIDAGDPDVVYMTVHGQDEAAGSLLDLFVSEDGGKTFTSHRMFVGGNGEAAKADVISPAADTVVVAAPATWQDGDGHEGATLLYWHDANRGNGFGGLTDLENGYDGQWVQGVERRLGDKQLVETNSSRGGPQFATDGAGNLCMVDEEYDIEFEGETHFLQCSSDGGATLKAPVAVLNGAPVDLLRSRVAVGPNGLVVVAYNAYDDAGTDSLGESHYIVSTDGGETFGADHALPRRFENEVEISVADVEVFIDHEGVIWFSRFINNNNIEIDKSCDQGETLSGGLNLPTEIAETNSIIFETDAGIFAGGIRRSEGTPMGFARILAPAE